MFTDQELEAGAKRVTLDYIASNDRSILVPETLTESEAREIDPNDLLVRADHALQFREFHGVFLTLDGIERDPVAKLSYKRKMWYPDGTTAKPFTLDEIVAIASFGGHPSYQKREVFFNEYCKAKGYDSKDIKKGISVLFQRNVNPHTTGFVMAHAHAPNILILNLRNQTPKKPLHDKYKKGRNPTPDFAYDIETGMFTTDMNLTSGWKNVSEHPQIETIMIIACYYSRISSMPKFQTPFVHELEIGIDYSKVHPEVYVLQIKQGRKIEPLSPFISAETLSQEGVIKMGYTLGYTSKQGEVIEYREIDSRVSNLSRENREDILAENSKMDAESPEGYIVNSVQDSAKVFYSNSRVGIGTCFKEATHHGGREDMVIMPVYFTDEHDSFLYTYNSIKGEDRKRYLVVADGFNGYLKPVE
jgi:hypothetical protein